jgi:uncharacterized OB-fold protein
MAAKPLPRIDAVNAPFFDGCNKEKVMVQRCAAPECRRYVYYPRVCCPVCHGGELDWVEVSGRGRIMTFTVVHRPHHDGFLGETPYVFAAVEIDEGPLIYGRIEGGAPRIGDAVEPVFIQHTPEQKLLAFRPGPSQ